MRGMKKSFGMILLVAMLATLGTSAAWAGTTTICHFPPGNPANFHTITVGGNAVNAHVNNHGDLVGSCLANCEAICDDGNACTIDVEPNLEQCICAAEPRAQVDCSDGNACTADSCDAANGTCINDPAPVNGNVCDDDNSNTTGDACDNGVCAPACPCFTNSDILANGAVAACGTNFPGSTDRAGIVWTSGAQACSGARCASESALTCAIVPPFFVQVVTPQEDQNCRALIMNNCANPN